MFWKHLMFCSLFSRKCYTKLHSYYLFHYYSLLLTSVAVIPSITPGAFSVVKAVTPSPARGTLFDLPPAHMLWGAGHIN